MLKNSIANSKNIVLYWNQYPHSMYMYMQNYKHFHFNMWQCVSMDIALVWLLTLDRSTLGNSSNFRGGCRFKVAPHGCVATPSEKHAYTIGISQRRHIASRHHHHFPIVVQITRRPSIHASTAKICTPIWMTITSTVNFVDCVNGDSMNKILLSVPLWKQAHIHGVINNRSEPRILCYNCGWIGSR